jgi:aminopeptidase N
MENWGLIVFKEPLLLVDPNNFSIQTKAEVGLVVSHEIAHQWFGNIVTMVHKKFLTIRLSFQKSSNYLKKGVVDSFVAK